MFSKIMLALALSTPHPALSAEVLTLKQAVRLALARNAEVQMAQAQEERARGAVREARSSFIPSVTLGSGLAATRGFPLSIEGSAPSIIQVVGESLLLNIPQRHAVRELQALSRASASGVNSRRDDVVWRTASAYLELDKATRSLELARREAQDLEKVGQAVADRVTAGVEIPLELSRAKLATARNRQRTTEREGQVTVLESTLKALLALPEEQGIRTVSDSLLSLPAGEDETKAISLALENNPELRRLEQEVEAKESRVRAERAQRWPQMGLVGQYAVLSRTNNYDDFFRKFERHNLELGVSIRLPLFNSPRVSARVAQAEAELTQARQALENARRNTALEIRRLFQRARQAGAAREVARLELDVARENVGVLLARFEEGRVAARDLEQARLEESARWSALLDADFERDKTRLEVLRTTGEIARAFE